MSRVWNITYLQDQCESNKKTLTRNCEGRTLFWSGLMGLSLVPQQRKSHECLHDYIVLLRIGNLLFLFLFWIYFVIMFSESPVTSAIWIRSIFAIYILYASSSLFGFIFIKFLSDLLANIEYQQASSPLKRLWVEDHRIWQNPLPL